MTLHYYIYLDQEVEIVEGQEVGKGDMSVVGGLEQVREMLQALH